MLVALVISGLYWLVYFDGGSAIKRELADQKAQIETAQREAERADKASKEVDDLRKMVSGLGEQFKIATQKLPTQLAMSDIIATVDSLARQSSISIKSKQPVPVRADGLDATKDLVEVIPLKISIEAGFSETVLFMYYVSITERIARVGDFTMKLSQGFGAKKLETTLEVLNYRFKGAVNPENKVQGSQ